ncbi:MAG TPA: hypothetical protein VFS43_23810 [Polyangiaceae bacterium]|nr:hypothetical protein [Polyangiaceae bacterium]
MRLLSASLAVLGVGLAACGGATPEPQVVPPAGVRVEAAVDPGRPDAKLLAAIAALPPPEPVLEGLRRASRDELSAAVAGLEAGERRRVERGEGGADRRRPLVALALGRSTPELLYELACRGGASRDLVALRVAATEGGRAPALDDVALSTREVARRAAVAYVWAAYERGRRGPPTEAALAERVGEAAFVVRAVALRRAAFEYAAARSPTPERLIAASFAASSDLDAAAAERLIEAVDRADARTLDRLDAARADASLAAALAERGGASAAGPRALEAAVIASKLGRHDLVGGLLGRAGVDASAHLQAAVADAIARVEGSLCGGLELSHEYAGLCPAAFRAEPGARAASERLRAAFASGRGRDAWSVERYAGLVAVVPMMYGLADAGGDREAAQKRLAEFRALLGEALAAPDGLPAERRAALGLVNDLLGEVMGRPPGGPIAIEATARAALVARARSALAAQAGSAEVRRAALAVAMAVALDEDPSPLLAGVTDAPDTLGAKGALGAWAGLLRQRPALLRAGLADLERAASVGAGAASFRAALYAGELRVAADASRANLQAFEARLLAAKPPPDASPVDRIRWAVDAVGVASRLGARASAEERYREASEALGSYPPDEAWRPLLTLFDALGSALLATSPEREARLRAAARLRPLLGREGDAAEVRAYRAAFLAKVLRDDELPGCRDEACRRRASDDVRRAQAEARAAIDPGGRRLALVRRGVVPGDASRLSLHFGFREGIVLVTDFDPRLCVLPLPPAI